MKLFISIVDHGYQIDMWKDKDLPSELVQEVSSQAEFSECRDWGYDVPSAIAGLDIVEYTRDLRQDLMSAYEDVKMALKSMNIDHEEAKKFMPTIEKIYNGGMYRDDVRWNSVYDVFIEAGIVQSVTDSDDNEILIKPINR